ncbi:MAG TPA: SGNH/GDSL hydrolase family protein [Pseudoxanthomonas sp.]|nr:SGNH/GDSL hydrolase family protein [Pseudoxanthomonas sp.]
MPAQATAPPIEPTLRYLALGDSYTVGEGVDKAGRWPAQLARALREKGFALSEPEIIARTGWTTGELIAAIDARAPQPDYGLVSLLIGVNNQYRDLSADGYGEEFESLLRRAVGLARGRSGRVLVLSIPDWGMTPFAGADPRGAARIGAQIDALNALAHDACRRHGVAWIDITAASRAHGAEPGMLVADGLHPSAAMYALWTRMALPAARAMAAAP